MSFRISARTKEDPKQSFELMEVTLHFDPDGLRDFAKFVQKAADDFDGPRNLDHYHFRDQIYTPDYHDQQRDLVSKDILIIPYPNTQADGRT